MLREGCQPLKYTTKISKYMFLILQMAPEKIVLGRETQAGIELS